MNAPLPDDSQKKPLEDWIARDARGQNFFTIDRGLQDGLKQYMDGQSLLALWPHLEELGRIAGISEGSTQACNRAPTPASRQREAT